MKSFQFIKENGGWFIDLPEFLAQGLGTKEDLAMVAGADTMLDVIADGKEKVALCLSREAFRGSDRLELLELCEPAVGGGYYFLKSFEGREMNQRMWLCKVTAYVFNGMPPVIYVRREP